MTNPANAKQVSASNPLLVVISAPSGTGKTTLCERTLTVRSNMARAITCTTRPPRAGEKDGVDYYFLDAADFLRRVQAGNFLEHATVYGHSYGTLKSEVLGKLRTGKDVLLNVDVQGAATIRQRAEEDPELNAAVVSVFLTPPNLGVLEKRLARRASDSVPAVQKRLGVARQEIAHWKNFNYLIISESIADDLRNMQAVIESEKMKTTRAQAPEF